jgi:hypothetical protein
VVDEPQGFRSSTRRSWQRPVRSPSSASTAITPRLTKSRTSLPRSDSAIYTRVALIHSLAEQADRVHVLMNN